MTAHTEWSSASTTACKSTIEASTVFACLPCAVSLIMQRLHGETETKAGIERAEQKQTATGHEANRQHQKQCAEMRKKGSGTGVRI